MSGCPGPLPTGAPAVEPLTVRGAVILGIIGIGTLFIIAAFVTALSTIQPIPDDPAERSRIEAEANLAASDAWLEFWSGGCLLVLTAVASAWPHRKPPL